MFIIHKLKLCILTKLQFDLTTNDKIFGDNKKGGS